MSPSHRPGGRLFAVPLLAAAAFASSAAFASPPAAYIASNCANCHGTDGHAVGGGMPGLAGLSVAYFNEQMKAFRDGSRKATIMHQIAPGYTEAEIAALAEYFAAQPAGRATATGVVR